MLPYSKGEKSDMCVAGLRGAAREGPRKHVPDLQTREVQVARVADLRVHSAALCPTRRL